MNKPITYGTIRRRRCRAAAEQAAEADRTQAKRKKLFIGFAAGLLLAGGGY